MTILLNPRIWIALALAILLGWAGIHLYRAGEASVQQKWDAQKALDLEAARAKEQEWQDKANETAKATDEQIQNIHARLDDALGELRKRPERPAVMPQTPSAPAGSTGAGLYRDDGEFLSRYAAVAATIAAERDACYRQYEQVRATSGP